jgi:GNAT superfamily N-acetyltransferase
MPARIEELPAGYRAVTPTMDDVARATEFFNLVEISEWGVPDFVESEIEEEWSDLDLEKSVVLVEDESGNYVASMTLEFSNGVTWEAFGYVHPEHQDRGLGTWVVRWSEAMARACEGETRDGYRLAMFNYISTVNGAAQELLTAEGYELQKVFRRMSIELQERPAPPDWPESYELRPFVPDRDQHAYFDAIQTAFAEHWSASPRTFESWSRTLIRICSCRSCMPTRWSAPVAASRSATPDGLDMSLSSQSTAAAGWQSGCCRRASGVSGTRESSESTSGWIRRTARAQSISISVWGCTNPTAMNRTGRFCARVSIGVTRIR